MEVTSSCSEEPVFPVKLAPVSCGGTLYLLRGGDKGLETVVVDRSGVVTRHHLLSSKVEAPALARVAGQFVAVWREPNGQRGLHQQVAGQIKLLHLDERLAPTRGESSIIVESTRTISGSLSLWASAEGRLAVGRTDRWRGGVIRHHSSTPDNPVYEPGFQSLSSVAGYDVVSREIGPWHEVGSPPILDGRWFGDTLAVVTQTDTETDDPFDGARLRHAPAQVFRFEAAPPLPAPRPD